MKPIHLYRVILNLLLVVAVTACSTGASTEVTVNVESSTTAVESSATEAPEAEASTPEASEAGDVARPANWDEATHSNAADPNYAVVFPKDQINQITITLMPEDWEAMQANMVELFGEAGTQANGGGFGPGGQPPADGNFVPGGNGEGFGPGGGDMTPENPMWVKATIEFNGQTWSHVGVRYKGNSSLTSAWRNGSLSLPLKLDFDEFEEAYPEIDNQRF